MDRKLEKKMSPELIERIKKANYEQPDFIVEDLQTLDFKEKNGALIIDYSYQRNFIQTPTTASKYIESVLLGLVIPEIQVFENRAKGYREIIDGQQRVLSLLKFLRNEYRLRGLTYLTAFNGKKFKDLPEEVQNVYRQFCVNMRVAKNSSEDYKYLLFERLNLGSKDLNQQEIRNCIFRDNPILQVVRMISNQEAIINLTNLIGRVTNERFLRDEFIVGLFSSRFGDLSLSSRIQKERINEYLTSTNDLPSSEVESMFTEFFDLIDILNEHYDLDEIMSRTKQKKCLLETIIIALWKVEDKKKLVEESEAFKMAILEATNTEEFKATMGIGATQANRFLQIRVNLLSDAINKRIA